MNFKNVLLDNFILLLYKICRQNWVLSDDNIYVNSSIIVNKNFKENKLIEPDLEKKIVLNKKTQIQKGWYFFGILHLGENRNSLLKIKTNFYFSQSRPAFANRRRWRVLRIKRISNLSLEISQIKDHINIKEIWLIKIPFLFAWFKIINRIKNSSSKIYIKDISKKKAWRKYNFILNKQFKKHQSFSYCEWIKFSEYTIYQSIKNKLYYLDYKNEDTFITLDSLQNCSFINKKWIVIYHPNTVLRGNLGNIIKWVESQNRNISIFYGDEDHLTKNRERVQPIFKSSWNRELFWTDIFYSSHWIISKDLWNKYFKKLNKKEIFEFNELALFIISKLIIENKENLIKHIPFILSHRLNNFYEYFNKDVMKSYKKNLSMHLNKLYPKSFIKLNNTLDKKQFFLEWAIPKKISVSIIIPTKDKINLLQNCLNSIYKFSSSSPIEIVIVNNASIEEKSYKYFYEIENRIEKNFSHKILNYNFEFNYSKINNYAAQHTNGNILILLNNDVEILSENWDYYLSSNAYRNDIGCVGAKLLFDDLTIQHAGVILGIGGVAGHSHKYFSSNSNGYNGRLQKTQEYSAVTAACLCITKQKWNEVGGLDESNLAVNYNDVDFCLKLRKLNYRNIYLPHVLAIHHESKTRGKPLGETLIKWKKEYKYMQKKWNDLLKKDPYYSPHLSLKEEDWSISLRENDLFLR